MKVQASIPGDILQFRDHSVEKITTVDVTFEDGSGYVNSTPDPLVSLHRAHHTAVVAENKGAFGLIILEQNIDPGGRKVQQHELPLASRDLAPTTEFRRMKHSNGKLQSAKVITTTTIVVRGTIWAYRPQAKR